MLKLQKRYRLGDIDPDEQEHKSRSTRLGNRDDMDDWEVDEMLEWTKALNFDDYYKSWQTIGTTKKS